MESLFMLSRTDGRTSAGKQRRGRQRGQPRGADAPPAADAGGASAETGALPMRWRWLGLLLAPLAAVAVYANSLWCGFVWEDRLLVVENPLVRSFRHLGSIFTQDYVFVSETNLAYGYYRPLS